jgi:hypothetical protein
MIKAMIVCGRTNEQIARQIGTSAINVQTFEKLAFNVRRYLHLRVWLRQICSPLLDPDAPPHVLYQARLCAIAFERGWSGLENLTVSRQAEKAVSATADLHQIITLLSSRALDYIVALELTGAPPTGRDLELLLLAEHRLPTAGLSPSNTYFQRTVEPPDPEREEKEKRAKAIAKGLSPLARRRLIQLLERIQSEQPLPGDDKLPVLETEKER